MQNAECKMQNYRGSSASEHYKAIANNQPIVVNAFMRSRYCDKLKTIQKKLMCGLPLCLREGDHLFVKLMFSFVFQAGDYLRVKTMLVGWWRVADTQCLESLIPRKIKYSFERCTLRSILFHITYTTNI